MPGVDLNSDIAEGFGAYTCGDDEAMLDIVTSANVACGFHAGDPEIMARTFEAAKRRGVACGAHPGFPDLWGFGRRRIPFSTGEIERLVAYQIGAAQALAAYAGTKITYVKCHGALGNLCEVDKPAAEAVGRAIKAVDPKLVWLTIAAGEQVRAAETTGLRGVAEIFADRGYTDEGNLIPRGKPGAMILDPDAAAERVVAMVKAGAIITASGKQVPTAIGSVCVHGDSAHAVESARRVRARLEKAGVDVRAFAPA
ncbi:MAG: LamB/YcsF family protein [Hyphomicrobiales bacterium]|nr:LamB/YcsF family protein [Hyphomicrobiales bacterium]